MSIADRVAGPPAGAGIAIAQASVPAQPSATRAASIPAAGERELRLDLFRGLALWLIFIDHVSPDLLSWFTIRSYGFSDAAEIFIFISGYTAAFVYGRAMSQSGFVKAAARILRRVWQIYAMHVLLFTVVVAEVAYIAVGLDKPFYATEMEINDFLAQPGLAMGRALLLRYRPLNMDVLPLYVVLMLFLPLILVLIRWRANVALAMSVGLYAASWRYDLHLTAYPSGFWGFNPFAWQMLFVFGAWCALGGTQRMSRFLASPVTMWIAFAYIVASFGVTLTWYFPNLEFLIPHWLQQWMYPISKTDLDVLRFAHFPGARRHHHSLRPRRMARPEIALAAADGAVRTEFAGDLRPRRVPGIHRLFRADRAFRRPRPAYPGRPARHRDPVRRGVAADVVQAAALKKAGTVEFSAINLRVVPAYAGIARDECLTYYVAPMT